MADIGDKAAEVADLFLSVSLRNQHRNGTVAPAADGIGLCLNCGADVQGARRWCDADCRNDWEAEQQRAARKQQESE